MVEFIISFSVRLNEKMPKYCATTILIRIVLPGMCLHIDMHSLNITSTHSLFNLWCLALADVNIVIVFGDKSIITKGLANIRENAARVWSRALTAYVNTTICTVSNESCT
jgi:hypothetical protein